MSTKPKTSVPAKRPLTPEHQALVDQRKAARKPGRPPVNTRDAVNKMQYGLIMEHGPAILKRVIEGAQDRNDPLHERCVDIMMKRVAPIAFWEGLSKQEFKPDEETDRRPSITITINGNAGLTAGAGVGAVDIQPVDTVDRADGDDDVVSEQ